MRVFLALILKMRDKAVKLRGVLMTTRTEQIEERLRSIFAPTALKVMDDSSKHVGHAGARPEGQTHYSVEIIAEAFRGKSRVESHRMVYDALNGMFEEGLHALAISAKA
jgi:BolA protein